MKPRLTEELKHADEGDCSSHSGVEGVNKYGKQRWRTLILCVFVQHVFVVSFSRHVCWKCVPGSVGPLLSVSVVGLETLLLRTSEMSKCAREEEEMWRPYAAVVSLLWLLLLINGAAMCCQVASALLSALSIHREKLHPAVSTSVHLAEHDGNRERWHVFNV